MATKKLIKGNVAICHGAIAARCDAFFGYPITPQNEIPEKMSELMPAHGREFLQAESEVAAINMVYGAACAGKRAMTSSSSPGISLKTEGLSYIAACELPCVIVNVQRGGPGLGNTLPGQADYFQAVKGGGHGDYRLITIAPWSVQECYEFMPLAFDLADRYRNPVMVLMDAIVGQMLEPVDLHENFEIHEYPKPWATNGARGRAHNIINSLWIKTEVMEGLNNRIQAKYAAARRHEVRYQEYRTDDADLVLVAYGSTARICRSVVDMARDEGIAVGLFRPISLYPFPEQQIADLAASGRRFLVAEMSAGQMVEDVRLAVNGSTDVYFHGRTGGAVPTPTEILNKVRAVFGKPPVVSHYGRTEG
ncbi:MAG: 3-methyl-2-oxobutanoate dehydrogenase subunit VorB [Armatimonadetes bacterium]|nr:3-methyl-2-oxobutanoate dehydrogenase subunit VorB [Armatimonadota bacterium]